MLHLIDVACQVTLHICAFTGCLTSQADPGGVENINMPITSL
jgi:hypothetical protein